MDRDIFEGREELRSHRQHWSACKQCRLLLRLIRWIIGFGLIGQITALLPGWSWLWWLGICLALFTPAVAVASQWLVSHKIRETETALAELEETMRELEYE